ncbi:MAG: hypothetical protein WC683_19265 [bacterium]
MDTYRVIGSCRVHGHVRGDPPFEIHSTPERIAALVAAGHIELAFVSLPAARKPPKPLRVNKPAPRPEKEKRTDA